MFTLLFSYPAWDPFRDPDHSQHDRHLDEHADNSRKRSARLKKNRNYSYGRGNRRLEGFPTLIHGKRRGSPHR